MIEHPEQGSDRTRLIDLLKIAPLLLITTAFLSLQLQLVMRLKARILPFGQRAKAMIKKLWQSHVHASSMKN